MSPELEHTRVNDAIHALCGTTVEQCLIICPDDTRTVETCDAVVDCSQDAGEAQFACDKMWVDSWKLCARQWCSGAVQHLSCTWKVVGYLLDTCLLQPKGKRCRLLVEEVPLHRNPAQARLVDVQLFGKLLSRLNIQKSVMYFTDEDLLQGGDIEAVLARHDMHATDMSLFRIPSVTLLRRMAQDQERRQQEENMWNEERRLAKEIWQNHQEIYGRHIELARTGSETCEQCQWNAYMFRFGNARSPRCLAHSPFGYFHALKVARSKLQERGNTARNASIAG